MTINSIEKSYPNGIDKEETSNLYQTLSTIKKLNDCESQTNPDFCQIEFIEILPRKRFKFNLYINNQFNQRCAYEFFLKDENKSLLITEEELIQALQNLSVGRHHRLTLENFLNSIKMTKINEMFTEFNHTLKPQQKLNPVKDYFKI